MNGRTTRVRRTLPWAIALAALVCAGPALAAPAAPAAPAAKPATRAKAKPAAAKPVAAAPVATLATPKGLTLPSRRPLVLDALRVEGKTEAPRVLFVHAGPNVALEDAPLHPSYLRDDFTAALSSPVRVRVRNGEPLRLPTAGGNR